MYRTKPSLADRDKGVRLASHHPAGHYGAPDLKHLEDEERARANMGLYPRLQMAQPGRLGADFRRTDRDRRRGCDVTARYLPNPISGRPMPGAAVEAIRAWNARIAALEPCDRDRVLLMGVPFYWLHKRRSRSGEVLGWGVL